MNNLTNDVTRLCDEIVALRERRAALLHGLARTTDALQGVVAAMLSGFRESRAGMAKQTKADLGSFIGHVREEVADLKQKVISFQHEFRGDLSGARRAWQRTSSASGAHTAVERNRPISAPAEKKRKK